MTQLQNRRLERREFLGNDYQVTPEANTPYEVVLMPRYWAHVSSTLRPRDILHVLPDDRAWFAQLLVVDVGPLFARVVPIKFVDIAKFEAKKPKLPDGYDVKFRGADGAMWCVTLDKTDLKVGLATEPEAIALALTHAAAVAGKPAAAK